MKRCPTCNRTFLDEHLSYCTDDGTPLVEQSTSSSFDPQATLLSTPPPTTNKSNVPPPTQAYRADEMPGWQTPGSWSQPSASPPPQPPAPSWQTPSQPPAQQSWMPPPPPSAGLGMSKSQQNPLAIASLAVGIFSMTIGLCCYMGFVAGPVAIGLGAVALSQLKNNPMQSGSSKGMAIAGIVTGAAALAIMMIFLILGVALRSF
ncbi:MAG TPA: DUF4190 domain-containing protein [Pyrinomonadaceae bacterium]|jgi:hypothetical protein